MKRFLMLVAFLIIGVSVLHGRSAPTIAGLGVDSAGRDAYSRSYELERRRDYRGAMTAVSHQPPSYLRELRLGWLSYLQGSYAPAVTHYRAAINMAPGSVEARLGQILPLLALKRYAETEAAARQILRIDDGNYYANLRLAYTLRMERKYSTAETVLLRMLQRYPTDVAFRSETGLDEAALSHRAAARRVFVDVLTLSPNNQLAVAHLR